MSATRTLYTGVLAISVVVLMALWSSQISAQQIRIGATDIGGVVTSAKGPEAGVWVVAETTGLGTKRYAKIVVTDDLGRYLLPALPSGAQYSIWVRGFGLVDSPRVHATPGTMLNLTATLAPTARAAAQYYSGSYWWSMLKVPGRSQFPGTGPKGNGMPTDLQSQADWMDSLKQNGCGNCHQAGGPLMRSIDLAAPGVDNKDTRAAWTAKLRQGQSGANMISAASRLMTNDGGLLARLADWTDRIAAGEVPRQKPDRPQGVERNIVVTLWDWSRPTAYLHDLIGTDRRKPTVNGWGAFYGAMELSTDWVPILDPVLHTATETKMPVRVASTPRSSTVNVAPAPWRHWGDRAIWDTQVNAHTNMMDGEGRVWWTATNRPQWEQPAFCLRGSDHPSAKAFPLTRGSGSATNTTAFVQNARGVTMYDPKTKQWTFVDTCFGTHHLNFGYDADNTLYLGNNGGSQLGWVNTRVFLETGDSAKAQGWTAFVVDTNGNGRRDAYVEPSAAVDPARDKRFNLGFYGIAVNRNDGTIWGSTTEGRGWIVRVDLGPNPPVTALTEAYQLPAGEFGIRGMDLDSKGLAWTAGAGGNLIRFDRSKCRVRNGPTATGDHCPEGFTFYPLPGPKFDGVDGPLGTAASPYYVWVDAHNIFGLGSDAVMVLENQSDGMQAFVDGKWVHIAVPYPMGFFTKGLEGRIDDPTGGWN
ncbi:MAG: hypothetical protein A3K13_10785, partial [Gemmatimonadetes bacterium RIFCSPLOWO2_12_FULL_68_9]